jgi:hypothetical protein
MDTSLAGLIRLKIFPTGRRLFAYYRVLEGATKLNAAVIAELAQKAIAADEATAKVEQRWAQKRRAGKTSAKQLKAQKELQRIDVHVDRALTGLRDGSEATIRGADDDEKELVVEVENFLNEIFPNGVAAVTSKSFDEESVVVKAIVSRLQSDLAPTVAKLGLTLNAQRLAKLSVQYEEALANVEVLDFGKVKAAREVGQEYLLRLTAKIMGTFDEPTAEHAEARAALLGPILKQDQAISDHIRVRRSVPDVDPETGEEEPPPDETVAAEPEPEAEPGPDDDKKAADT